MPDLEQLRRNNPKIQIFSVQDPEFRRYGRILRENTDVFLRAGEQIPMPEAGAAYRASLPELEALPETADFQRRHWGGSPAQMGLCWGYNRKMNALEWHTCNEMNVALTDLVLLLAKREQVTEDLRLDAGAVRGFYVQRGQAVEIYADTLHFTPCQVRPAGFACLVSLAKGTNLPLTGERTGALWCVNKWLLASEKNTTLVDRGAVPGILGENWEIQGIEERM